MSPFKVAFFEWKQHFEWIPQSGGSPALTSIKWWLSSEGCSHFSKSRFVLAISMNRVSKCDDFWQFSLKIWWNLQDFFWIGCRICRPLVLFLSRSGEISPEKIQWSVSYTHIQITHFPKLVYPNLVWNFFESCIPFPAGICFEHYKTHTQLICSNPCTLVLGGY